jgi:hypothetical protein
VERTQISLTAEQADRLRRLASERGTSMAALLRDAVDRIYPEGDDADMEARWRRALESVGGGRSGHRDISRRHDEHLADVIGG